MEAATTTGVAEVSPTRRKVNALERWLGTDNYRILRALVKNPLSITGFVLLALFIFVAVAAPVLAPPGGTDPYVIPRDGFSEQPKPPGAEWNVRPPELPFWWQPVVGTENWTHLFGTASGQWDIYYGVVWGTRTAFQVGLTITAATLIIGLLVGSIAAYYGGVLDNVLMRITDIFLAFPFLVAALTLAAVLTPSWGRSIWPAMAALITFGWMSYARLIRSDILSVKQREFVTAAKVIGTRDHKILLKHILPNAIFPTLVVASLDIGSYVLNFAALSFLGVGVQVGYADWGQLISFARAWITNLDQYWYIVFFPGAAIVLFVTAWNLIGDAVRDVFDPRMRGQGGA